MGELEEFGFEGDGYPFWGVWNFLKKGGGVSKSSSNLVSLMGPNGQNFVREWNLVS